MWPCKKNHNGFRWYLEILVKTWGVRDRYIIPIGFQVVSGGIALARGMAEREGQCMVPAATGHGTV